MSDRIMRIVVFILAVAFAVSPFFSSGFGGFYRESFPVQVSRWPAQPAGWAFSIWGLIYLGLILASGRALLQPGRTPEWGRVAQPLGISLLIGVFWIEAATRAPVLATVMILPMAAGAIIAMLRAGREWPQLLPLGLYAGWLTAASGVALSVVLTGYGLLSAGSAAILLLVAVLVTALAVAALRPAAWGYRAGVIWALIGVIAANVSANDWLVVAICGVGIILLIVGQARQWQKAT